MKPKAIPHWPARLHPRDERAIVLKRWRYAPAVGEMHWRRLRRLRLWLTWYEREDAA